MLGLGVPLDLWAADPLPSSTSVSGDHVTNPQTGDATTVSALITDPAGTATAGDTAFVRTADGYVFLVKAVGDIIYNNDTPPLGFKIISKDTTAKTVELQAQTTPVSATNATLGYQILYTSLQAQLLTSDTAGAATTPVAVVGASGVRVVNTGNNGSNGRAGALFVPPNGGGNGATGPAASYTTNFNISTTNQIGLEVGSVGGKGGKGGSSYFSFWSARDGGDGGAGGTATAINASTFQIATTGTNMHGIYAYSIGGKAGDGGDSILAVGGGTGGHSSNAGNVLVENHGTIITTGDGAFGIYALSVSNNGGNGGDSWGLVGSSGSASYGGNGGNISITNAAGAQISTTGVMSHGILAQSIGGSGGSAGISGQLLVALSGSGDNGGSGGTVEVSNSGTILTGGDSARGIFAQSIGGGGGAGGTVGGLISVGGSGSTGGNGGAVTVKNLASGIIQTKGYNADGIVAQSIGGSGGSGSDSYGLVAVGGGGSGAGNGSTVTVENYGQITTQHDFSRGILAQSIGGGGGDGGSSGGMVSVGGNGSGGGTGDTVTVKNGGTITTKGADSTGILAQSIGGGGGNGGSSGSIGIFAGVAVGGKGSTGGKGGDVTLTLQGQSDGTTSLISTAGDRSEGIFAQSVGGGGGNGGGAFSVSAGFGAAASFAIGGQGGGGGNGGTVTLNKGTGTSWVQTSGADSTGVFLQSVGGGGGNGGYALSLAVSGGPASGSFGMAIGGKGSGGGVGGTVTVGSFDSAGAMTSTGFNGTVLTTGDRSTGFMAQSVGGGGGNGGLAVAGAAGFSPSISGAVSLGLGGNGGGGGNGGVVQVGIQGNITTQGESSTGLLVQSVGGGGGNGGGSIAASLAAGQGAGSVGISMGGDAGTAGNGNTVNVATRSGTIITQGSNSSAIVIQSVGGGGGNGGYSVAASLAGGTVGAGSVDVALGGKGGSGGNGGKVTADLQSDVETSSVMRAIDPTTNQPIPPEYAENSAGIVVQSVGGGGGNGGFSVAVGGAAAGQGAGAISVGLGGKGGAGGIGDTVTVTSSGKINTMGNNSAGIIAQSIGGGGGNGGYNVSVAASGSGSGSGAIDVGLGGNAGAGSVGGVVTLHTLTGKITTGGDNSVGVLAQSVGGGGGNGGFNIGIAVSGASSLSGAISVGLGGSGGTGANADIVTLTVENDVKTSGRNSAAVVAQSIGGGGGNGGYNVSAAGSGAGSGSGAITVGLGGSGGGAANGANVTSLVTGNLETLGADSAGFITQSIGGGGGNGGYNLSLSASGSPSNSGAISVGLGGSGANGGAGKTVNATSQGTITTSGTNSAGFIAQSIGGGGGNGGYNVSLALSGAGSNSGAVSVGLGGSGAGGGDGGIVIASTSGNVTTNEDNSAGIVAQSIGGGGGNGGFDVSIAGSGAGEVSGAVSVGLGGSGSGGGNAEAVTLTVNNNVITKGKKSTGIIAQSIGGGGGSGGFDVTAALSGSTSNSGAVGISLGGSAGTGGFASAVTTQVTGDVTTSNDGSGGILSQSLGGGGGNGGMSIVGALSFASSGSGAISIGLGGSGGDGGYSDKVTSTVTGTIKTGGADSIGIMTQSLGGGGGNGGISINGAISMAKSNSGALAIGIGGAGGGGGDAADVKSTFTGYVQTTGNNSSGIVTQSLGGGGGNGGLNITGTITASKEGSGSIAVGLGGFGGDGGNGKDVISIVTGGVSTTGATSDGIVAQSFGGGGGNGGLNVTGTVNVSQKSGGTLGFGLGGFGGAGGNAGNVTSTVTMTAANPKVKVTGAKSSGIVAQSLGGGGGNGGIDVTGAVNLTGENGAAIGIGIGGFGGGAGNAGIVTVNVSGQVITAGNGILAQSIGGGGGDGGINITSTLAITQSKGTSSTAVAASIGVGGFGAGGGTGGAVSVSYDGTYVSGVRAIVAQSIGGGGGNGGLNVSSGIAYGSGDGDARGLVIGVGGFGGAGGNADTVNVLVTGAGQITAYDAGILAQSIGGGGGNGGTNVSGSITSNAPLTVGVGGSGANAGVAKSVTVDATANFTIYGAGVVSSAGVMAQSLGGGGGNGGVDVTGSLVINKTSSLPSVNVGVGGFGGAGAISGDVTVTQVGSIYATGAWAHGIMAQSIAGGGGNGGLNVSGQLDFAAADNSGGKTDMTIVAGVGGNGGLGANAGDVVVTQNGIITTSGDNARGIMAQSIGGGGGTGGMNITGVLAMKSSPIQVGVGGTGGGGGDAGSVTVTRGSLATPTGQISTNGKSAHGIEATSIGGGGGDAGMNFNLGLTRAGAGENPPGFAASFTIGGAGGQAANGDFVIVDNYSSINTQGANSHGIIAQSIGGGGGNASFNIGVIYGGSNNTNGENKNLSFALTVGGGTGDGGHGGSVQVVQVGDITTIGKASYGIVAQSIGGGGGNAGLDFGMDIVDGGSASITIGRKGGTGGYASDVTLSSTGAILTRGAGSYGLLAQSVGNGGGNSSATSVGVSGPKTKEDAAQGASVSVGLEGGVGGYAGNVILNAAGSVTTRGDDAHAIFAQSVGGGGGNGGSSNTFGLTAVTMGISIGGLGGEGGYSGTVSVDSSAQVFTYGKDAIGILAQSIGGGGGTGGMSTSGGLSSDVDGITIGVGGSGGTGMYSGKVFVDNSGVIITDGIGSYGILAQSLGGGGGNSGLTVNATLKDGQTDSSYRASITVGGTGGTGGKGGDVQVTNTGGVGTSKQNSIGIFAQSVGGGGGNAGTVITATTSNDQGGANTAITIGGSGGTGGTGGAVSVVNKTVTGNSDSGKIITVGAQSHGIAAMSVGGGGGTGSTAISLLKTANSSAANTTTTGLIFSLGGSGGGGGTGGTVYVENGGSITTYGQKAYGILAQSIGGGGGDGGVSVTGDLALGKKTDNTAPGEIVSIAIGGIGGSGNSADTVTVVNTGSIVTSGKGASGIFAQSVGGGGGDGGFAATLSMNLFTNPATNLLPSLMTFGMGGNGGSGANGGDVVVTNSGSITVNGENAYGIFAQSVAGGGGQAAFELTAPVWMAADFVANVLLGARNGSSGDVGTVTITSTGTITMNKAGGTAQFAQTVTGGGGNVNRYLDLSQHAATIDTSGAIVLPNNGGAVDTVIGAITSVITLGADGVSNLVGKGVDASHVGDLYTYGEKSVGSLLQSIGGGGGNDNEEIIVNTTTTVNLSVALGAKNSSNNSAGNVTSTRTGNVATAGYRSVGGSVQSIGGGGGTSSTDFSRPAAPAVSSFAFSIMAAPPAIVATGQLGADGGVPGSSSNGGNILITYTGVVSSTGDRSPGLIFQTIGGGGGAMNFTGADALDLAIGGINGAAGNGGNVDITNTGIISTTGLLSNGLVVQSIGGGGGIVSTDLDPASITIAKNTTNTGNGGNITFIQNGNVLATGDRSTAVLLQSLGGGGGLVDDFFADSAGGVGNSGTISFTMNGSINAGGAGGVGIFAQSKATGTQGNITLSLAATQTLYFGSGGAGVHISGGATNTFTNNGSIIGADLISGWGILGEGGNDAVVNHGLFVGQADLGTGTNSFANKADGVLLLGPQFLLGAASNLLTNDGILRPGATGLAQRTDMTGSFIQSSTGTTFAELDLGTHAIDQVYMNGTAKLAGRIDVALLNPQVIGVGHFEKVLFHADGGVTNDGAALTTTPSVVVTYDLQYPTTGKDAVLAYDVNFNPPGSNFGRNLVEVGGYINNIQNAGSSPALAPTIVALLYAPNLGVYRELLSQLGPDFYGEQQGEMLRGTQRFGETMLNGGSSRFSMKERTIWFDFLGSNTLHSAYDDYKTVRQQTLGFALGFEDMISPHWSAGMAISYEDNNANGYQGRWNANGSTERVGGMLRYKNNGTEIAAMIGYGWSSMDSTRAGSVYAPFATQATRGMQTLSAMVRIAHEFVYDDFYLKPQLDLGVTHLSTGATTENGNLANGTPNPTNLALQGLYETHAWIRPAVTIRKAIIVTNTTRISLHTEMGYQYYINGNDTYVRAGFTGAPNGVDGMNVPIGLGSMASLTVGMQVLIMNDLSIGLYYTKAYSNHYHLDLYNFRVNKSF